MKQDERKDYASRNMAGVAYGEMIRNSRRKKGMSQEELGALAHVGKNAVGAWEAGRSRPDLSSVPVICENLGISINDFFGIPEAADQQKGKQIPDETVREYRKDLIASGRYEPTIIAETEELPIRYIEMPVSTLSVSAGTGEFLDEENIVLMRFPESGVPAGADFALRVSGDSMEPRYHDGDQVLVQHTSNIRPGEIGIFVTGDMGYIKEFRKEGLRSLNPEYPLMRFSDMDEVRCIGRVIGTMRKDMYASIADIEHFTTAGMRG